MLKVYEKIIENSLATQILPDFEQIVLPILWQKPNRGTQKPNRGTQKPNRTEKSKTVQAQPYTKFILFCTTLPYPYSTESNKRRPTVINFEVPSSALRSYLIPYAY